MKIIRPIIIDPSRVVSSNVAEPDPGFVAWSPSTGYTQGARVMFNHHLYICVAAIGNTVTGVVPGSETSLPFQWQDLGASNRFRMFDKRAGKLWQIGTFTVNPSVIDVTIRPNAIVNAVGLVGVNASTVQIIMTDSVDGEVYNQTVPMRDNGVTNWFDYFFAPYEPKENAGFLDLPAYGTAQIRVIINAPSSIAQVAMLVVGTQYDIGWTQWGSGIGFDNYSKTEEDDFGNVTITPRGSAAYGDFDLRMFTSEVSKTLRILNLQKDIPSMYLPEGTIDAAIVFGLYDKLYTVLQDPTLSIMALKIRSLQ